MKRLESFKPWNYWRDSSGVQAMKVDTGSSLLWGNVKNTDGTSYQCIQITQGWMARSWARHFSVVLSNRIRGNVEVVESFSLQIFKNCMDMIVCNVGSCLSREVEPDDLQRSFPTSVHSMWFCVNLCILCKMVLLHHSSCSQDQPKVSSFSVFLRISELKIQIQIQTDTNGVNLWQWYDFWFVSLWSPFPQC